MTRIIVGIGNYSMGDDGIGLRIVEAIADRALDTDFKVLDVSGNGLELLHYFDTETEKMLWIDAMPQGLKPGEWRIFSIEEVETQKQLQNATTHGGDMVRIFALAKRLDHPVPPIRVLGIEPERMELEMRLSESLKHRFEEYVAEAIQQIRSSDW